MEYGLLSLQPRRHDLLLSHSSLFLELMHDSLDFFARLLGGSRRGFWNLLHVAFFCRSFFVEREFTGRSALALVWYKQVVFSWYRWRRRTRRKIILFHIGDLAFWRCFRSGLFRFQIHINGTLCQLLACLSLSIWTLMRKFNILCGFFT